MKKLNSTIFVKCFLVLALIAGSINLHSQSTYNFLVTQFTGTIGQGSRLQQLVRVQLNTGGRDVLDSMRFKLTGKDNIQSARLYYGGNAFSFWMSTYGTEVTTFSTDTLTFARNGSENFDLTGDVYFYLVLELKPTATVGQILDAECLKAYLNGFNKLTPAAGNPAGARKIVAPMTGTYTIKGAAGPNNFTKLSAAIDTLNRWGFTGGVTFILQDDSVFAENFSTKYIYQTGSLTNPIIIKRSGTGSAMPIVRPAGTNSGDDAGFTFWGSDFVTIDGIMIDGPTVTSPNKVDFGVRFRGAPYDGCQNITVQNCRIKLDSILDTRAIVTQRNGGFVMAATGTFDSVKILNNTVSYVRFGIVLNENNGFTQFPDKNGLVGGNIISNIGLQNESIGIFVRDQQDLKVFNNEIKDSKTGPNMQNWLRGMDITSCVGPVYVYGNKVHALINSGNANNSKVLGINVSAQTSYIYNNMVWDLASPASTINNGEVVRGITVSPTNNIGNAYIYNNSVFLNNVMTNFIQYTACMWVENTISTVEFKNNIFVAQATGPNAGRKNVSIWYNNGIALDRQLISSTDNNLYYAGIGSVNNLIIRNGGTEYQTLKAYQAATFGRDLHAITENAPFVSAYDLHINSSVATWIENGALPIGLVTTDIDGDPRNATTPDIGADEGVFLASLKDSLGPLIVYTLFADTTYSLAGRILSNVFITDTSKVDSLAGTKPRLYYKKSNNANAFPTPAQNATAAFNGWRYVEATNNSSPFNFPAMNYAVLNGGVPVVGTVIEYFVVAQDLHVGPNIAASPAQSIGVSTNITSLVVNGSRITNSYKIISNTPMSGDYLIGVGDGEPWATLNAAYTALSNTYITGPVRLLLNDATYNLAATSVTLGEVRGASKTNTITIKPNVGVSPVISYTPTGDNNSAIILNGADYYTIDGSNTVGGTTRDLTFQTTTTDYSGAVINVRTLGTGKGAKCDTIKNCIIRGVTGLTDNVYGIASGGANVSTGDDNDSLVIQNNYIYRLRYGIYVKGMQTGIHNVVTVIGNTLDSLTRNGMEFERVDNLLVDKNIIRNINTGATAGGYGALWLAANTTNAVVSNNQIYNVVNTAVNQWIRGINIDAGNTNANITVINNMVSGILAQNSYGIVVYSTGNFKVIHNSVNLHGDLSLVNPANNLAHAAFRMNGSLNGEIVNNIFNNTIKTAEPGANSYKTYAFYLDYTNNVVPSQIKSNNNALWVYNKGTTDKGWFGWYNNNDRRTFNDWRALTGYEANGFADSIPFVGANDLHVDPAKITKIEGAGAVTSVLTDFDNESRSATPDIGADEGAFLGSQISTTKSEIVWVSPYSTLTANPGATILFQAKDASGNNITTGGEKVTFYIRNLNTYSYGTVGATYDSLNGRYTALLTATRAGSPMYVNAMVNGIMCTDTAWFVATNNAPTAQSLSRMKVNEGIINAFVGTFKTIDADTTSGDKFTYTLVTGTGSTHNAQFKIVKDSLFTQIAINYTFALPTRSIRVRAADLGGLFVDKVYTISINDRPTNLSVNPSVINDSLPSGTMVASLSTLDSNGVAETFTYTLVPGPGDTNNVSFYITGNMLYVDSSFKKVLTPKIYIRVKTVDQDTLSLTKDFVITYNSKPTGLYLTKYIINEGLTVGSLATKIRTIDADSLIDVYTYTLEAGGTDNALFKTGHDSLIVNSPIVYATKSVLAVKIKTTDYAGSSFVKDTLIKVNAIPTDIPMSRTRLNDGTLAGKFFAKLSTVDPGSWAGAKFTYAFATGGTDNALFTLSNDSLFNKNLVNYATKPSYSIKIRTTDSLANFFEKTITIPVNVPPTNIVLSKTVINDSTATGTVAMTLSATDPNGAEAFTYSLVAGAGDTNNVSFHLSGNSLIVDSMFVYSKTKSIYVRLQVMDQDSLTFQKAFVISVNTKPTDIFLSPLTVNEAAVKFTLVGNLNSVDPNGHALSYTLPAELDNAQFSLSGGNKIVTNAVFDYETQKTYQIKVRGTDPGGLFVEKIFTITILNVYESPTDITITSTSVDENAASGSLVGEMTAVDPDSADVIKYTLVAGSGSTDNASFKLVGDSIVTNATFDYETKKQYSIRVRATDKGNKTFDKVIAIFINDLPDNLHPLSEIAEIYPVPTNGILNIRYTGVQSKSIVKITDMNGKQVYSGFISSDITTLDLTRMAKGMYVIQIIEGHDGYSASFAIE